MARSVRIARRGVSPHLSTIVRIRRSWPLAGIGFAKARLTLVVNFIKFHIVGIEVAASARVIGQMRSRRTGGLSGLGRGSESVYARFSRFKQSWLRISRPDS